MDHCDWNTNCYQVKDGWLWKKEQEKCRKVILMGTEAKMKEFDFERWWKDESTVFMSYSIDEVLSSLQPLYDKMKEWGFYAITIDFRDSRIVVCREKYHRVETFNFKDICDFPRALKEAWKFMFDHRINQPKLTCNKDGPCDEWRKFSTGFLDVDYMNRNNMLGYKFDYCPFCGEKR